MTVEKRTSVDQLIPGMVLAEPIFHPMSMQMIWNSGTTLTDKHIALLQKMNLGGIRVMDFVPGSPQGGKVHTPGVQPLGPQPGGPRSSSAPLPAPDGPPPPPAPRPAPGTPAPPPAAQVPPAAVSPTRQHLVGKGSAQLAPPRPTPNVAVKSNVPMVRPSWEKLPEAVRLPQRIKEEVLSRNVSIVKHISEQVRHASRIDISQVDNSVQQTIRKIVAERELIESLIDLRVYDEYTYAHSANVMSLSLVVGTALKLPMDRLRILGIGALLHDIGKTLVPEEILNKPTKLTEEEFRIMATHPANGIMILSNYSWANSDIKNCAFQHHEKYNGMGYPMGLKGNQIAELAQIVAVVDFYDALISDRVYKKGLPPNVVYQAIMNGVNVHFDAKVVQAFQRFIVPYPVNAQVELSTGQVGRVLKVNRKNLLAPVVHVEGVGDIDLAKNPDITITTIHKVASQHPTLFTPPPKPRA
ncbi:MAG: HD-GYP domain-containing protein [Candidatus Sericytochromatia bacterium]|nr:HD-GYP domain-containing protein [Candidatus Tanganyikabacteria bacterium]